MSNRLIPPADGMSIREMTPEEVAEATKNGSIASIDLVVPTERDALYFGVPTGVPVNPSEEVRHPDHRGYMYEDGVVSVYIPPECDNAHTYTIFSDYLPRAMRLFAAKNAAYGNASERFGVVAQYMKMVGKLDKLEKPLYEDRGLGQELEFEGVEEVLFDLIGHALETIYLYNAARENKG